MMLFKSLRIFLFLIFLSLFACGKKDDQQKDAMDANSSVNVSKLVVDQEPKKMSSELSDGGLPPYDPDVPAMVVEDNGVVYQDEIYNH